MDKVIMGALAALLGLALLLAVSLLVGLPVMWLWNALMPGIFGLGEIGFWQAVGLSLLAGFLTRGSSSSASSSS